MSEPQSDDINLGPSETSIFDNDFQGNDYTDPIQISDMFQDEEYQDLSLISEMFQDEEYEDPFHISEISPNKEYISPFRISKSSQDDKYSQLNFTSQQQSHLSDECKSQEQKDTFGTYRKVRNRRYLGNHKKMMILNNFIKKEGQKFKKLYALIFKRNVISKQVVKTIHKEILESKLNIPSFTRQNIRNINQYFEEFAYMKQDILICIENNKEKAMTFINQHYFKK